MGFGSFDALLGIPGALQLAHENDLADVISIVCADMRNLRGELLQGLVVGSFHELLQVGHHLVELPGGLAPLFGVEVIEGLVVVAVEFGLGFAGELGQLATVPEEQMISELPDRVIAAGVLPVRLIGGEPCQGHIDRHEPILLVMRGPQLLEQYAAKRDRLRGFGYSLERKQQNDKRKQTFHGHSPLSGYNRIDVAALCWRAGECECVVIITKRPPQTSSCSLLEGHYFRSGTGEGTSRCSG